MDFRIEEGAECGMWDCGLLCWGKHTRITVLLVLLHEPLAVWPGKTLDLYDLCGFCIYIYICMYLYVSVFQSRVELPRLLLMGEEKS